MTNKRALSVYDHGQVPTIFHNCCNTASIPHQQANHATLMNITSNTLTSFPSRFLSTNSYLGVGLLNTELSRISSLCPTSGNFSDRNGLMRFLQFRYTMCIVLALSRTVVATITTIVQSQRQLIPSRLSIMRPFKTDSPMVKVISSQ